MPRDISQLTDEELEAALQQAPGPDISQLSDEEIEAALTPEERYAVPRRARVPFGTYTRGGGPPLPAEQAQTLQEDVNVRNAVRQQAADEREAHITQQIQSQIPEYNPRAEWRGGEELDIGYAVDFSMAQRKWRAEHPEGELLSINTDLGNQIIGRTNPDEEFAMLPGWGDFTANLLSGRTAGGIAGGVLAPRGYIFPALGVMGLSTLGGMIQSEIERARGYDDRTRTDAFVSSLGGGGVDAATELGARVVLRGVGVRAFDTAPQLADDLRAIRAAERAGFPPLMEGVLGGEFWRGLYAQTAVLGGRSVRRTEELRREGLEALGRMLDDPKFAASMTDDEVSLMVMAHTEALQDAVFGASRAARSPAEAARVLQEAIENYRIASKSGVDHLYNVVRGMADDTTGFNIGATQRALDEHALLRPIWTRLQQTRNADGTFDAQALQEISGYLSLPRGLVEDLAVLRNMDPNVRVVRGPDGSVTDAFEQMTTMRSRFFNTMHDQNQPPAARELARTAWHRLTTDMENIVSGNPDLVDAWRTASAAYRTRATNLESAYVRQVVDAEGADAAVRRLFSASSSPSYNQVRTLWSITTPAEHRVMRDTVKADFLNGEESASTLIARLDGYQNTAPEVLNLVIPATERATLREALVIRQQFESSPAMRILEQTADRGARAGEFLSRATRADIDRYIEIVPGGEEAIRYAIISDITDHARRGLESGGLGLDGNALASRATHWLGEVDAGRIPASVFNESIANRLHDFQVYGYAMSVASDVGGGMMAGSLRSGTVTAVGDVAEKGLSGFWRLLNRVVRPLYSNNIMNWWLSREANTWNRIPAEKGIDSIIANTSMVYASIERQLERQERERTEIGSPNRD